MSMLIGPGEQRACVGVRPDGAAGYRPRVLHLINNFEIGGTERQAVELLKRLDSTRYGVGLAALRKVGPLYREISVRFPNVAEFPVTNFYNANAARQFMRLHLLLVREQIDILHAHDFYAAWLAVVAAQKTRVRVIACQRHLRLSDRRVHDWGRRIINRLAHRILVNSEAIRRHIIATSSVPPQKIVVINNGLNLPEQASGFQGARDELCRELGLLTDVWLVGMVANLRPVKGHSYFINAARTVLQRLQKVHFVLVGDGPLRREIETQAARLGIADRVHLLGHRIDGARLQAGFDVAVLASLHEGFPNSVMEAMGAGVAVVATAVGGVTELIEDGRTGFLVHARNAEALADRIVLALTDAGKREAVAASGRQFVITRLGMSRMVEAVEKLYAGLMLEREGPDSE